ncbi:MAG: hypothetical protein A2W93_02130 [Bacteroidetes bacterium GWF2_43_63]|nr:MAG: hypothetical protein A2W94_11400 [Bacteroidetes bacterium GWE2_42_42]OFY53917.1 MAG: hypothetical protein A2W93_02130 [Bacteroidetes bacterium GWF2_43_63]HBG69300.1 hypothetical protein [Bacteroidales bacterium]HCB60354.1 hypothetical protein [Bacteroidales bacterium]HCY23659.1 hypothetical protein [Bacteroidales bacterium]
MRTGILLFLLLPALAIAQKEVQMPDYPSYQQVMTKFLTDYDIMNLAYPEEFRLTKNPDGWHAVLWNYEKEDATKNEIFWSRSKNKYVEVPFKPAAVKEITPDEQAVINDNMNITYDDMSPYNFYRGWYKDVINEFGEQKNLSDTMLNALARAYANHASNLLGDQFGLSVKSEIFSLSVGQNVLSEDQLKAFRLWHDKSLETYKILLAKNPAFATFIGDALNIYSNEVMAGYLYLLFYSNETEARKELRPGLYDDFILKTARNYLNSCDKNAILFTSGDNDTYPLLYVQAFEKFRTDVTIVNMSLLGIPRYISHLFEKYSTQPAVEFSIARDYWNNSSNGYYYILSETDSMNAITALNMTVTDDLSNEGRDYALYPARHTVLKFNNKDSISIFPRENYIYLNHFAMLDIIASNIPKRPVYFTITSQVPMIPTDYLLVDGMAYKVVPYRTNDLADNFYSGGVDPERLLEKLKNDFQMPDLTKLPVAGEHHQLFSYSYRMIMYQAFVEFVKKSDTAHAMEMLDMSEQFFPYRIFHANASAIPIVQYLYKLGEHSRADKISFEIISGIIKEYPVENSSASDIQMGYSMLAYLEKLITENSTDLKLHQLIKEKTELYRSKAK